MENQLVEQAFSPDYQKMKIALNDIKRRFPNVNIELTENYDTLSDTEKEYYNGKNYNSGINGYYNSKTDTVIIFADNVKNSSQLEKTFCHETAGHKGLEALLGNEYTSIIDEIYSAVNSKYSAELRKIAQTYNQDLNTAEGQRYVIEEYLANQADLNKVSGFKAFIQKIKLALRKVGFRAKWTDDEILTLMRRSLANQQSKKSGAEGNGNVRYAVNGKYFKNWQDVIEQFKKDLEGIELNQEQQGIYDVVTQQKDKIKLRINDLNELEDIFVNFGTRKKGVRKFISVHYAGLRNPVTALEVLNIGDVIRRGKITEEGTKEHPTSRRYELQAEDGAMLKVIIDFNRKNDKNKSVINFYSDRKSDTGAHNVSSGIITDLSNNLSFNPKKSSGNSENLRFSVAPQTDTPAFKEWFGDSKVVDENGKPLVVYHGSGTTFWEFKTEFTGLGNAY